MLNTYGPTEGTVVATAGMCSAGQPVTIGTALPGYTTHVLDEQLQPVTAGQVGELFIGGFGVARGYLNRPELTSERFSPDKFSTSAQGTGRLYRTFDLVRRTAGGDLQFVGRKDTQLKIRGYRVELAEIEAVLLEQPGIRGTAVTVRTESGIQELAAFVVAAPGTLNYGEVFPTLHDSLPEYMIPKYLDIVPELPRLTSGKLDRAALPESKTLLRYDQRQAVPPETANPGPFIFW